MTDRPCPPRALPPETPTEVFDTSPPAPSSTDPMSAYLPAAAPARRTPRPPKRVLAPGELPVPGLPLFEGPPIGDVDPEGTTFIPPSAREPLPSVLIDRNSFAEQTPTALMRHELAGLQASQEARARKLALALFALAFAAAVFVAIAYLLAHHYALARAGLSSSVEACRTLEYTVCLRCA